MNYVETKKERKKKAGKHKYLDGYTYFLRVRRITFDIYFLLTAWLISI